MPRLNFVKSARKAIPDAGVAVGDSYYWWKNRAPGSVAGFKRVSKTRPKPSQLVGSDFLRSAMELGEEMSEATPEDGTDLELYREQWRDQLEVLADEQDEKRQNMSEALQSSPTAELLEERAEGLRTWAQGLDSVTIPEREDFPEGEDGDQEFIEALQEAANEMARLDPGF